jgi:NAD(P)-dependent dehydrogenase (short-subunit alcohol dehydrogenase family)
MLAQLCATKNSIMQLKNKVAVITGGNSGIGLGIAKAFQQEGAKGAIVGRNQATLDSTVAHLGDQFIAIKADVTRMDDLERMFSETTAKFGKIDTVVVNAGGAVEGVPFNTIENTDEAGFDLYMDLNLKSAYFTVQKALPYIKDGATIVLIGSIAAHQAFPGQAVYAAAKAGVVSFARGLSHDLLHRKIRINVVSPGTIDTPAFDKLVPADHVDHVKNIWTDEIPLGRIGLPADVGAATVFLASDASGFIIGEEIIVDGGATTIRRLG